MDNAKLYALVPGKGDILPDGSWWTNSSVKVGYISTTHHYWTKYDSSLKTYFSKPNVLKCVETSTFGGEPFARWEQLESEWREAIKYSNQQMDYK